MSLRQAFINWFTSARYVAHLEAELICLRGDKDAIIFEQRARIAALEAETQRMRYEIQQPRTPKAPPVPEFKGTLGWQDELERMTREEEEHAGSIA